MDNYQYNYEWDSRYCYPNSFVLRNKLGIKDVETLETAEREITSIRMAQLAIHPVKGSFNLEHLKAIHASIFEKIYPWAGQLRTVNIAKGNMFCNHLYIQEQTATLFQQLKSERYLIGISSENVPQKLAFYLGEINAVHPFREGNGRTQRIFIQELANISGYEIRFSSISPEEMIEASALAFNTDYSKMIELFRKNLRPISQEDQRQAIAEITLEHSDIPKIFEEIFDTTQSIDQGSDIHIE